MVNKRAVAMNSRTALIAFAILVAVALLALLVAAAFPVGWLRGTAEERLSSRFGAPVQIGSLGRTQIFSFHPEIVAHDVRIGQPQWAGQGHLAKVQRASTRISVLSAITGNLSVRSVRLSGMELDLVRDASGKSNWSGRRAGPPSHSKKAPGLEQLEIENARFRLRDGKRRLNIAGTIASGDKGLSIVASGTFNGSPARLAATGAPIDPAAAFADWPFEGELKSPLLDLTAKGSMAGALNMRDMQMAMTARATSLKELDHVIEAGLFGSQPIDFKGKVRHSGRDWFIDTLDGTMGRSHISGKASILKRGDRTLIDGDIHSRQFDFDDLATDAGLAEARAKKALIGDRVIPDATIDLSNMGPTDGTLRFVIDELLVKGGSAFRSLKGELVLDHRVLQLNNLVAGLESGRVIGWAKVDSTRPMPLFSTELRIEGTSLDALIRQPEQISGPMRGLVRISGPGKTIREAFSAGTGKVAFVTNEGRVGKAAAFVIGQDLGGAISQQLRGGEATVPLRCAILSFDARDGILRPDPVLIQTQISTGKGSGQINLDGETIAITVNGDAAEKAALKLVDPIHIGGTLSKPQISVADSRGGRSEGGILSAITRSVGSALGLRKDKPQPPLPAASLANCDQLASAALR